MSRLSWILFTTLSIIHLTCTTVPPATTMSMEQSPSHVAVSKNANISCYYTSQRELNELKILLLKGVKKRVHVCSYSWKPTSNTTKTERDFNCSVDFAKKQNKITFHLQNLHVNQTDVYSCEMEVLHPPPYKASESHKGTIIYVKGVSEVPECQHHQHGLSSTYMLMIAAIIIFIVYSVTVTAVCYYCWRKAKKNRIVRNDYFNMTPWQTNGVNKRQPPLSVPARNYTAYRSWEP